MREHPLSRSGWAAVILPGPKKAATLRTGILTVLFAIAPILVACTSPDPGERVRYACGLGLVFSATYFERRAVVSIGSRKYDLPFRRSSPLGDRYGSSGVVLVRDEDRAVLIDSHGRVHRGCTEVRSSEQAGRSISEHQLSGGWTGDGNVVQRRGA